MVKVCLRMDPFRADVPICFNGFQYFAVFIYFTENWYL